MKLLSIILVLCLSGCYLANGSPSSSIYWEKRGNLITQREKKICYDKSYEMIYDERYDYLKKKYDKDYMEFIKNDTEYQEISKYFKRQTDLVRQCFYELGYRFTAPIYWCLALDKGGINAETCLENMKYRY